MRKFSKKTLRGNISGLTLFILEPTKSNFFFFALLFQPLFRKDTLFRAGLTYFLRERWLYSPCGFHKNGQLYLKMWRSNSLKKLLRQKIFFSWLDSYIFESWKRPKDYLLQHCPFKSSTIFIICLLCIWHNSRRCNKWRPRLHLVDPMP